MPNFTIVGYVLGLPPLPWWIWWWNLHVSHFSDDICWLLSFGDDFSIFFPWSSSFEALLLMVDTLFFVGYDQPPSAPRQAMKSWQIAGCQPALAKVACWCGTDGVDRGTKKPKTKRNGETWTDNSKKNHRTSEKKQKPGEIKKTFPLSTIPVRASAAPSSSEKVEQVSKPKSADDKATPSPCRLCIRPICINLWQFC